MSRLGSSSAQSGGGSTSRMVHRVPTASSSRLDPEESGLPLIPCPDCGLARVIEMRSAKQTTKNYLRVYFKCPRNAFPKLCGFYEFQRGYLEKLKKAGIVRIHSSPAEATAEVEVEGGDAMSGNIEREMKMDAKEPKKAKLQSKIDDLIWKFNLLLFVFAVLLGSLLTYVAVAMK